MARKLPKSQEILNLIQLAEQSRLVLDQEAILLRQRLDIPSRVRSSLKQNPSSWIFGSAATGLAASLLLRRPKVLPERKKRGIPGALLGLTLTAARPIAKIWLANQAKRWIAERVPPTPPDSIRINPSDPNPR